MADWNKGDLEAFLGGYWNSPKVVFQSGGQRYDGWEAMRDRYRRRYQAEGKAMGRLAFSSLEIEPLGPEAVMVRGGWRLTMPDGTRPGRAVHPDLPQVSRRMEDRPRPHLGRGTSSNQRRREQPARE